MRVKLQLIYDQTLSRISADLRSRNKNEGAFINDPPSLPTDNPKQGSLIFKGLNRDQTQVLIKAKGYKQFIIPASEITDELWQKIPLTPKTFHADIDNHEFFEYANYQAEYRLQDVKGIGAIISELSDSLPQINSTTLSNGFLRWWNADQRIEYVYYTESEALATIEEIKQEFVANCYCIPERELFAFKVAQELGMELIFVPVEQKRWIRSEY